MTSIWPDDFCSREMKCLIERQKEVTTWAKTILPVIY